jgi:alcohol dehydrogenase, propanol-preferring
MHAWQFIRAGQPLVQVQIPDPTPPRNGVVVDVRAAGLCSSDVGIINGTLDGVLTFAPIVLGHEVAGVISEVGDNVAEFKVGDRVAIHSMGDGTPRVGGNYIGTGRNGGYAEKTTAWTSELIKLPDGVDFDQAAAATDAGMTAYHALFETGGVRPGTRVGIVGLGGLGLNGARLAVLAGAEVFAAGRRAEVNARAVELGVTEVVTNTADLVKYNLDVIVDFAGFGTTTAAAIEAINPGGRVVQVGLGVEESTISTYLITMKQVTLVGSLGGTPRDTAEVVKLITSGDFRIATRKIGFDEIGEGLGALGRGEVKGERLVAQWDP